MNIILTIYEKSSTNFSFILRYLVRIPCWGLTFFRDTEKQPNGQFE